MVCISLTVIGTVSWCVSGIVCFSLRRFEIETPCRVAVFGICQRYRCENLLETEGEGVGFLLVCVQRCGILEQRVCGAFVLPSQCVESFQVDSRVCVCGQFVAGFNPAAKLISFYIVPHCSLQLSMVTEGFGVAGPLEISKTLSRASDQGVVLRAKLRFVWISSGGRNELDRG